MLTNNSERWPRDPLVGTTRRRLLHLRVAVTAAVPLAATTVGGN
jgi:hypothetical protein